MIKRYWHKLCTAIAYFRLGWNDFDWDQGYLYELLLFKLKRMEKYFRLHGVAENTQTRALEIRKAIEMIEWLMSYEERTGIEHEKLVTEYGIKSGWVPTKINGKEYHYWEIHSTNGSNIEEFKDLLIKNHQNAEKQYMNKVNELFHHLRTHIEKWWD